MYNYTEEKMKGKGPVESEGFMNALSSQAAKMKEKKRKLSKVRILSTVSTPSNILAIASQMHSVIMMSSMKLCSAT
jgi:hypothetical protein